MDRSQTTHNADISTVAPPGGACSPVGMLPESGAGHGAGLPAELSRPPTPCREALHPVTLAFASREVEQAFVAGYHRLSLPHWRWSLPLAMCLYAIFGVLDGHIIPEAKTTAWVIRYAVVCPFMAGVWLVLPRLRSSESAHAAQLLLAGLGFVASTGILGMIARASPPGSNLYYAGLLLTCAAVYTFLRLRFVYAVPVAWASMALYEGWALLAPAGAGSLGGAITPLLLNHTFFLAGMNVIGMSACYTMERAARDAFLDQRTIAERTSRLDVALRATASAWRRAEDLARRDPLTGLYNRRHFFAEADAALASSRRHGAALSVAMLDLDHFKAINDHHGHAVGDAVLQAVAATVRHSVREQDLVCRYGGEEFLVLLPRTNALDAGQIGWRLRHDVERLVVLDGQHPIPVTVSIGVASLPFEGRATLDDLIQQADSALYRAKAAGRNRVVLAST
jgi:diguanylate cyclase (GGDEF)-like protein